MSGNPPAPYRTRLDVLFASGAEKAVVLRRGPRTHYHLVAWDLRTDAFEHGQWMKGEVRLCDLSPDGDKLIYWAAQRHASARYRGTRLADDDLDPGFDPAGAVRNAARAFQRRWPQRKVPRYLRGDRGPSNRPPARAVDDTWTAISTPPFFTALVIWPSFGTWTGGGYFRSAHEIVLWENECGLTPVENTPLPSTLRVTSLRQATELGYALGPSAARPAAKGELNDNVALALLAAGATWVEWVHSHGRDLLFACDGRIYRLKDWAACAPEQYLARAALICDLTGLSFQLVRAPHAAMRWR